MPIPFILGALGAVAAAGTVTAGAVGAAASAAGAAGAAGAAAAGAALAYKAKKELENNGATQTTETNDAVPIKDVYTTDEAAKVLGMSKPTVLKKLKEGLISYVSLGGRSGFRIRREALEAYAVENNIVPNWAIENNQLVSAPDASEIEAIIKHREIEKKEAELELEEMELEEDSSTDHKRKIIQMKKAIIRIDKDIQEYKMLLMGMNAIDKSENE